MSIASELTTLNTTKQNIKAAIEAKGISLSGVPFTNYPSKIEEIEGGGGVSYGKNTPYIVDTNILDVTTTSTSQTTPIPLKAKVGDLCIAVVAHRSTLTTPVDWTLINTISSDLDAGIIQNQSIFFKSLVLSDLGASITFTQASSNRLCTQLIVLRSTDQHSELEITSQSTNKTNVPNSTSPTFPVLTASKECIAIGCCASMYPSGTYSTIDGWQMLSTTKSGTANNMRLGVISKVLVSGETVDGKIFGDPAIASYPNTSISAILLISAKNTNAPIPSDGYVRPSDWLPLPAMSKGEQKVAILVAIYDHDSNIARLRFTGAVTIDWGDGVTENIASNTQVDHTYTYTNISNDTLCSRGYKQAVIIVTPQTGQNLTVINTTNGITTGKYKPFLDIRMCGQYFNTFNFNYCFSLEQFEFIGDCAVTSLSNGFYMCYSLENFISLKASICTTFYQMFYNCTSLKYVSNLITSAGTNFSGMFVICSSLRKAPTLDTSNGTDFSAMFGSCYALKEIPLLDTSKATTVNSMFQNCNNLRIVPALNLTGVTNAGNFVSGSNYISRILITNIKISFSISGCFLSVSALVELFINLPTVTSATITITNNLGASELTAEQKAIATNKGWTITN